MTRDDKLAILNDLRGALAALGMNADIRDDALEIDTEYSILAVDHDEDGWFFTHSSDPLYLVPGDDTVAPRLADLARAINRAFVDGFPGCQSGWRPSMDDDQEEDD
jgi:hypothetical protein